MAVGDFGRSIAGSCATANIFDPHSLVAASEIAESNEGCFRSAGIDPPSKSFDFSTEYDDIVSCVAVKHLLRGYSEII